jgi:hypothetical protein
MFVDRHYSGGIVIISLSYVLVSKAVYPDHKVIFAISFLCNLARSYSFDYSLANNVLYCETEGYSTSSTGLRRINFV